MTATTWAMSPAYGRAVALGPAQRDVLRVALHLTASGRRPELTLARLAQLSGRPVSSVHDALGRLRALGILGVSARMGRHGGHRIWRVRRATSRTLDTVKRRLAIARIVGRWGRVETTQAASDDAGEAGTSPPVPRPEWPTAGAAFPPVAPAVKPPEQTPPPPAPRFGERLRQAAERQGLVGLRNLIDEWESDR